MSSWQWLAPRNRMPTSNRSTEAADWAAKRQAATAKAAALRAARSSNQFDQASMHADIERVQQEYNNDSKSLKRNSSYGIGTRIIKDRHAHKALGGEDEAGYGIGNRAVANDQDHYTNGELTRDASYSLGNRIVEDRHAHKAVGGGVEAGYGIGMRESEDKYTHKPLGGEIEAGYGIGNRVVENRHSEGHSRRYSPRSSAISDSQYNANAAARLDSRPF